MSLIFIRKKIRMKGTEITSLKIFPGKDSLLSDSKTNHGWLIRITIRLMCN